MAKAEKKSSGFVQGIRLVGRTTGPVKTLRGFRKGQHTVPDAVNPTTLAFLGRLCAEELGEEAEALFQRARGVCAYKRKDLDLSVSPPGATLTAKDFTLEIVYSFDGDNAAAWRNEWQLSGFTELDFLRGEACGELFSGRFQELVFSLDGRGGQVEAVIDAVEELEDGSLRVDYPSDYAHCMLSVPGVDATVRFDGMELAMVFPCGGSPAELLDGFLAVREAFSLSKSKALSGLLG